MEDIKEAELTEKLVSESNREKKSPEEREILIKKSQSNNILMEQLIHSEGAKNRKIYTSRRNKSIEDTKLQREKVSEWMEEDRKLLNTNISIKEIEKFVSGDIETSEINNERRIKQIQEWSYISKKSQRKDSNLENSSEMNQMCGSVSNSINSTQNVILKNKIIRPESSMFNLRCLAMELEVNLLMAGESTFYIFSRGNDSLSSEMAVCYIDKELESSRKFINFAVLDINQYDQSVFTLKTLKKQEIPKQENYIKNLDICEVKILFIDNGDNKCYVFIENESTQKQFTFMADFYIPTNQISNVMLAASGDLISLRSLTMRHIVRNQRHNKDDELGKTSQSCTCCSIY